MSILLNIPEDEGSAVLDALSYWHAASAGDFGRVEEGKEPSYLYEARRAVREVMDDLERQVP